MSNVINSLPENFYPEPPEEDPEKGFYFVIAAFTILLFVFYAAVSLSGGN